MFLDFQHSRHLAKPALLASVIAALGLAGPAHASDTSITQTLTPGTLSASVVSTALPASPYQYDAHTISGNLTLTVDDSTGSGAGWNVTLQASDFIYTGSYGGTDISAANFFLVSAAVPLMTVGQAVDATGGPRAVQFSPPLELKSTPRKVIQADPNFGQGTYTQNLGVSLLVPAFTRIGTYSATLTITSASAP